MTKEVVYCTTQNILYKNGPAAIEDAIEKVIRAGADIIGLQEMGASDDQRALNRLPAPWRSWHPGHPHDDSNPVAWDSRKLTKIWLRYEVYSSTTNIDDGGPGPGTYQPRTVAVGLFECNRSKQRFIFINCHAVPASQGPSGNPWWDPIRERGKASKKGRAKMALEQFRNLRDLVLQYRNRFPVVVVGDFNVDYVDDRKAQHEIFPYSRLGKEANCWPNWKLIGLTKTGTHGPNNYIDWVCLTDDRRARMRGHKKIETNSDHDAVIVGIEFDSKASYTYDETKPDKPDQPDPPKEPKPEKPPKPGYEAPPPFVEVKFDDQCV